MKTFSKEFDKFLQKIKNKEPFAFVRFSDGELFMLQNKEVKLAENHFVTGQIQGSGKYTKEEQKHFIPEQHSFYRQKLIESLQYKKPNYFKGICARGDVSPEDFMFQIDLHGGEDDSLTFANLFINANYSKYIKEIVPLFTNYENIALVVNEAANVDKLPFKVSKVFKIGSNCIINDFHLVDEVSEFLKDKDGWLLLCSASSLSNYIIHKAYEKNSNNTMLDIGSSLNPMMGLEGWKYSRGYLQHYWLGQHNSYGFREEIW